MPQIYILRDVLTHLNVIPLSCLAIYAETVSSPERNIFELHNVNI